MSKISSLTPEELAKVMRHPGLSGGERRLLDWQYGRSGDFYKGLWQAICHADSDNLSRLEKGFPSEVQAYRDFAHTGRLGRYVDAILNKQKEN